MSRAFFIVGLLLCFANSIGAAAETNANASRPNIVVFLCDDLGYGDLQCYGHPHIKTPNLNQMAADGVRFTDFYSAAPVCSPSRVGLLTGRNPNRAGVYDWIPPSKAGKPRPDAREQVHLRRDEITIPALLKDAGYATCMAGKWHCNSRFNDPAQPQPGDFGFDHWLATQNNAAPSHKHPMNFVRNGNPIGKVESFSCNFVAEEASNWLKQHRAANPDQPFFIYMPFHEPHEPVASPQNLVDEYLPGALDLDEAHYRANVANVDVAVGSFLNTLDELGLRDDTLVVFTSDNGPETLDRYKSANRSYGVATPLRGMKLHTHDAGFRVAGIVRWPGKIPAGETIHEPVSALDLLPTFCELAGAEKPDRHLDGTSLVPMLSEEPINREQPLFWCYYNAINEARVAMRHGDHKVLARINGGELENLSNLTPRLMAKIKTLELSDLEIYDVTADISETTNLAESNPELARRMKMKLDTLWRELNDDSHVWDLKIAE